MLLPEFLRTPRGNLLRPVGPKGGLTKLKEEVTAEVTFEVELEIEVEIEVVFPIAERECEWRLEYFMFDVL